jgi:hypothetical protein
MPDRRTFLIATRAPITRPEPTPTRRIKRLTLIITAADRRRLVEASGRCAARSDRGKADQRSGRDKCEKSVHLSFSFGGAWLYPKRAIYHPRPTPTRIYSSRPPSTAASNGNVITFWANRAPAMHCRITVMLNCPLLRQPGQNICCRLTKKRMSELP